MSTNPYDQVPYRCQPIEWTAPERLALTSRLHGGPLPDLSQYRVLELGCGDGSNLIPMAYYRPQAEFIGVDGGAAHISTAQSKLDQLAIPNLKFLQQDFSLLESELSGKFDFIIVHGVFSWVADPIRDAMFELCQRKLKENGLLYLNYNTRPGWDIRGLVRAYLLKHTQQLLSLTERVELAQQSAKRMAYSLAQDQHPYSQLLANEFQFVCDNHPSYVAHEFLTEHNKAYWRSEFLEMAQNYYLYPVADADYNYPSGLTDRSLPHQIESEKLVAGNLVDTLDLISYRQLHTPIFSKQKEKNSGPDLNFLKSLNIASCLYPIDSQNPVRYQHPNGYQVEVKENIVAHLLNQLLPLWPQGVALNNLLENSDPFLDDFLLLHHNGLVELRLPNTTNDVSNAPFNELNWLEQNWGGFYTNAYHQRVSIDSSDKIQHEEYAGCGH